LSNFNSFFVNSYPRSGNTWIRLVLVDSLKAKAIDLNPVFSTKYRFFSTHEFASIKSENAKGCIFKSHLMYDKSPQDLSKYKGVYLLRDGRDSMLSYYFYNVKHKGYTESWDVFFDRYFERKHPLNYREKVLLKLMSGWGENVQSYLNRPSVKILRYEDLVADPVNQVKNMIDFLGLNYDDYKDGILANLQKSNESLNNKAKRDQDERKRGTVGSWSDFYSEEQNIAFISRYGKLLEQFGYLKP